MNYNDYYKQVKADAIDYIDEQFDNGYWDADTQWDIVYDDMFCEDSITGNASGPYTFNAAQARENISEAIWDEGIRNACNNMGVVIYNYVSADNPEGLDVAIRCAMLSEVYDDIEKYFSDRIDQCN